MKNLLFLKIWRAYALHTKMSILFAELFCIYKFGITEKHLQIPITNRMLVH